MNADVDNYLATNTFTCERLSARLSPEDCLRNRAGDAPSCKGCTPPDVDIIKAGEGRAAVLAKGAGAEAKPDAAGPISPQTTYTASELAELTGFERSYISWAGSGGSLHALPRPGTQKLALNLAMRELGITWDKVVVR